MIEFKQADQRIPDLGILPPPCTWDYAPSYEEELLRTGNEKWARFAAEDLAHATCPQQHSCRLVRSIHSVDAAGMLSPSYVCPADGCTFHDYVQFVGWARK